MNNLTLIRLYPANQCDTSGLGGYAKTTELYYGLNGPKGNTKFHVNFPHYNINWSAIVFTFSTHNCILSFDSTLIVRNTERKELGLNGLISVSGCMCLQLPSFELGLCLKLEITASAFFQTRLSQD